MNDQQTLDKVRTRQRLGSKAMNNEAQSTYRLLIRSQEKGRGIMETIIYALLILSVVVSIFQFAHQQNQLPAVLITEPTEIQYLSHQPDPGCDGQC